MSAKDLKITDFTYELPDDRIARYPLPVRDEAKLLHYQSGQIQDYQFTSLPKLLPPGTLLIGNATRVIHARLFFTTLQEKQIEIFCLDPLVPADYQQTFSATETVHWKCLIGGNRKWKRGKATLQVPIDGKTVTLEAERIERLDKAFEVAFSWDDTSYSFGKILDAAGQIPLPPYLGRPAEESDHDRYQTVFSHTEGSVAAPTAGLHLSERLMQQLKQQNMNWGEVILHVGAGTFQPVTADTIGGHDMHREYFEVDTLFLQRLAAQLQSGQPIVSVGTTTTRCLESLFYLGCELHGGKRELVKGKIAEVAQWVASEHINQTTPLAAIQSIMNELKRTGATFLSGSTQLIITPDVRLRIVDGMITNFHQPNSTLLLIVAAITGDDWRKIYNHALGNNYRFLSYGDGSLLWCK